MPRKDKKLGREKQRVLLLCAQPLLGDGLKTILGGLGDVELVGPLVLDAQILDRVSENNPNVMLIVEEGHITSNATSFTARILEHYPDVPIIRAGLTQDTIRLYISQTLPARSTNLIKTIRRLPALSRLLAR